MSTPEPSSQSAAVNRPGNRFAKWIPALLPLGWLWFHLIRNLWPEWDTNPQYSYGLVVPVLVAGLLLRRWMNFSGSTGVLPAANPWPAVLACGLLAFCLLPMRLIEEATPEWRPLQWLLAFETIGLTLYAVYLAAGKGWLRLLAFPLLFFLVAVPWPTLIEHPVIQGLTRLNTRLVVEVLGILGVPAIPHGNVIEVSTGVVGINDACSGIRSLQSSLMIALFLGEFYFFNWRRRLLLLPIGFLIAMGLNLCRASLLTWIAAKKGLAAIAEYHDQAGLTILLVCTAGLWAVGWLMNRAKTPGPAAKETDAAPKNEINFRRLNRLALTLVVWIAVVEAGVALWYHLRESNLKPGPGWTVNLPTNNPTYQALPLTEDERILLRFDEAKQGLWQEADGTGWQAFYFNWKPGRVAGYLAKRHTPDICLTATGLKMTAGPTLKIINVHGVDLPMRCYTFDSPEGPLQVFQCHWEAGLDVKNYTANESARFNLIRGIWAGRGNQGQKVLEVVATGYPDLAQAGEVLTGLLDKLVAVENHP